MLPWALRADPGHLEQTVELAKPLLHYFAGSGYSTGFTMTTTLFWCGAAAKCRAASTAEIFWLKSMPCSLGMRATLSMSCTRSNTARSIRRTGKRTTPVLGKCRRHTNKNWGFCLGKGSQNMWFLSGSSPLPHPAAVVPSSASWECWCIWQCSSTVISCSVIRSHNRGL